ncbi:LOW QUALITY PROTEIN: uncharacterized protein LOC135438069 [Drosophila montana]|uniref:LOW QUALITY PROTEIN: uncharacterized protein LOC135438069 n=1 Tax=Drosophila montana TaxID=40370 RepID=UPI00313D8831
MSEVFCDRAARWFLSSGLRDVPWSVFRRGFLEFFLPPRYFERLEDEIRSRRQRVGEEFKEYLIELRALMHHATYEPAQELHRIYENAAPEYRLYVRRQDFSTLSQLTLLAVEYETVMRQRAEYSGSRVENMQARIRLADGSTLEVGKALRLDVGLAGKVVSMLMLIMPSMLDHVILGMDFLGAMGTTIRCGIAKLDLETVTAPIVGPGTREEPKEGLTRQEAGAPARLQGENTKREPKEGLPGHGNGAPARQPMEKNLRKEPNEGLPCHGRGAPGGGTAEMCQRTEGLGAIVRIHPDTGDQERLPEWNDHEAPSVVGVMPGIDEAQGEYSTEEAEWPADLDPELREFLDQKEDWRVAHVHRQLNAHSIPDAYPVPRINHILERLRHDRFISTLDLKHGYWQIPMAADSRECTAFTVPGRGIFQWRVMPFGLHSACATFQRALDTVIGPEMEPNAFAYLDDIVVIGATKEQHVNTICRPVFRRLRAANLKLNRKKCSFFRERLVYLGHVICGEGIRTDPERVEAIRNLRAPTNCKELRQCLGMASWYRRFVPNFATQVQPLTALLKKGQKWAWEQAQEEALRQLKDSLTTAPVLACPDFSAKFVLQTDASEYGLGAELTQTIEGQERVIAYASRKLLKAEVNYSATEKECLAIVWSIRKLRCYLEGYRFDVVTDHLALKWLNSIESPSGRIARWALELQQFQFHVHYRRGKLNVVADALSRHPLKTCQQAVAAESPFKWVASMRARIAEEPAKFPDYTQENGQLYRHLGHRKDDEDYIPWKLCVASSQHLYSNLTAGHRSNRALLIGCSTPPSRAQLRFGGKERKLRSEVAKARGEVE